MIFKMLPIYRLIFDSSGTNMMSQVGPKEHKDESRAIESLPI